MDAGIDDVLCHAARIGLFEQMHALTHSIEQLDAAIKAGDAKVAKLTASEVVSDATMTQDMVIALATKQWLGPCWTESTQACDDPQTR